MLESTNNALKNNAFFRQVHFIHRNFKTKRYLCADKRHKYKLLNRTMKFASKFINQLPAFSNVIDINSR